MQALYVAPQNGKGSLDLSQVQILTHRPAERVNVWAPPMNAERKTRNAESRGARWQFEQRRE